MPCSEADKASQRAMNALWRAARDDCEAMGIISFPRVGVSNARAAAGENLRAGASSPSALRVRIQRRFSSARIRAAALRPQGLAWFRHG